MPLVILEGPEKVGKTTFADKLCEWWSLHEKTATHYVHRPREANDPDIIREDLKHASQRKEELVIFDRFYPSDLVYRTWDGEESKFPVNAFEMDRIYGRRVQELGMGFLLLGEVEELERRRTPDDIPIPPALEQRLYNNVCPPSWIRWTPNDTLLGNWERKFVQHLQEWRSRNKENVPDHWRIRPPHKGQLVPRDESITPWDGEAIE